MEIFFCDVCGHRVSDVEIERGECRRDGSHVWCKNCLSYAPPLPAPRRRPASGSSRPAGARHTREHPHVHARAGGAAPGRQQTTLLISAALGVSVASLVVIVAMVSRGSAPPRRPQAAVARPRSAPSATPIASTSTGTAARNAPTGPGDAPENEDEETRFARLGLASADRYASQRRDDLEGIVARYESVAANYPGTTYAQEADDKAYSVRSHNAAYFGELARKALAKRAEAQAETMLEPTRVTVSPTIDGALDDWGELPFVCKEPAQVLMAKHSWTGPSDSQFAFGVSYNDSFVFVGVDVRDDKVVTGEMLTTKQQDGVEVRIDARPDPARSQGRGEWPFTDFLLFALSVQEKGPCYVNMKSRLPEGTSAACARTPAGYAAEVAVPVKYLDAAQKDAWHAFRLNVTVADFDGEAKDRNEAARLCWRPDWASDWNRVGSGTFVRRTPMPRLAHTPRVDGDASDWQECVEGGALAVIDRADQLCSGKKEMWQGTQDLSARIYAGWTDGGLYVLVEVTDDEYVVDTVGKNPWRYDCIEYFYDVRDKADQETVKLTPGTYQICASPAERPGMEPKWRLYPDGRELPGVEVKSSRTATGYVMELKFPLSAETTPAGGWGEGRALRFAILVDDKDESAADNRAYTFGWAASPRGSNSRNTSGWRRMYLSR